jgi:hypothetical protein
MLNGGLYDDLITQRDEEMRNNARKGEKEVMMRS